MRQIAREKEETSHWEMWREGSRHAGCTEYRKRKDAGRKEWRAGGVYTRRGKKVEKDKTEDEATQEEGRRERNKGGMTTRMARSYSLGYNSAVLGQCKLNESFSPRRTRRPHSPVFLSFPLLLPVRHSRRRHQARRTVVPVQQRKHQTKGTMRHRSVPQTSIAWWEL